MGIENPDRMHAAIRWTAPLGGPVSVVTSAGIVTSSLAFFSIGSYPPAPFPIPFSGACIPFQLLEPIADTDLVITEDPDAGGTMPQVPMLVTRDPSFPGELDRFVAIFNEGDPVGGSIVFYNLNREAYEPIVL